MQTEIISTQTAVPAPIKDKTAQLKKQIFDQLREVSSDPEMFSDFMKFIRKFHNYSLYNRILIFFQRRDASQVAGYRTWQSLGRQVKKGESGISIFAPKLRKITTENEDETNRVLTGFRVVNVFDYDQTIAIDPSMEELTIPSCGKLIADNPEIIYEKLKCIAESSGIKVIEMAMEFAKAGATNGKVIKINRLTDIETRCSTILHEISHVLLKHSGERITIPRYQKEIEAEFAAFLAGSSLGLPKGNYEYITGWLKDECITDENIDQAIKTSDKLLNFINIIKYPMIH